MHRLLALAVSAAFLSLPAAAQSFYDGFGSTTLDPAWTTVAFSGARQYGYPPLANHHSLTDSPGSLRYYVDPMTHADGFLNGYATTFAYHSCCNHDPGLEIYRTFTGDYWLFETKVTDYTPNSNGRNLDVRLTFGDGGPDTYKVRVSRGRDLNPPYFCADLAYHGTPWTTITSLQSVCPSPFTADTNTAWIRVRRAAGVLTAWYSTNGTSWNQMWTHDLGNALAGREQRLVITGGSWHFPAGSYADYDYVSLDVNSPPVLAAIGGKSVQTRSALSFTVSGSDADEGDTLTYSASGLPTGASFNPATRTFSWTPLYGQQGSHDVTFAVTDGDVSDSETVTINVTAGSPPPALSCFRDDFDATMLDPDAWSMFEFRGTRQYGYPLPANRHSLTASAGKLRYYLDPMTHADGFVNGYATTFSYHSCCNHDPGLELHRTFTGDSWVFETKVTDFTPNSNGRNLDVRIYFGDGGTDTYKVRFSRGRDLNPPYFCADLSYHGSPWTTITSFQSVCPSPFVNDTNTAWIRVERDEGVLTASYSTNGSSWNQIWTHDLGSALEGREQRLTIAGGSWFSPAGSFADYDYVSFGGALALNAIGDKVVQTATPLTFTVSAGGIDACDTITFDADPLPEGATFDSESGEFSWTPLFGQQGEYDVTFTVDDGDGGSDSETITIDVNLPSSNVAPVLADVECMRALAGSELAFSLGAIDGNGDTISYSANGLPAGASLHPSSGAFSWTPSAEQAGLYSVTFYASDGSLADSDAIQIAVGAFASGGTGSVEFDVYNQGRSNSAPSHARAWLSDRASLGEYPLGTGKDTELDVALDPPPGAPDPNSTPVLAPGAMAHYTTSFAVGDGFGRLAHDGDPDNAAVENEDGTFTVMATAGTSSRVGFLFERYLWVDADGARDESNAKLDEAGQTLEELLANDAQKSRVAALPPTFGELALLSATFTTDTGGAGDGTPRLEVHLLCHGVLRIRLDGSDESDLNVIGDGSPRFDTTGLTGTGGPLSSTATYAEALELAGQYVITRIDFVADDPGPGTRTYTLTSINVSTALE